MSAPLEGRLHPHYAPYSGRLTLPSAGTAPKIPGIMMWPAAKRQPLGLIEPCIPTRVAKRPIGSQWEADGALKWQELTMAA
jgi:hypothetical protein